MSESKRIGKSFRLLDFHTYDNKDDEDSASDSSGGAKTAKSSLFYIQIFGLNEKGETASITLTDYQPFFYVKVGEQWSHITAQSLLADIKSKIGKNMMSSVLSAEIVDHNKLYGFAAGKKSRFVKLTFTNVAAFNRTKNLWYQYDPKTNRRKSKPYIYKKLQLELYESNIPPLLRFFHIQQISPSGWVFIQTKKMVSPKVKTTTCHYEYVGSLKHISPLNEKETRVPYKICSFDIEASSSHGDFPLPKKTYKRFATQLVDAFQLHSQQLAASAEVKKRFMTKAIAAAFGCDKCSDIDLVYTLGEPLKKPDVKARITALLETPVPHDAQTDDTIETLFEKMNQQASARAGQDDDSEPESEVDVDDDEPKAMAKPRAKPKPKAQEIFLYDYLLKADVPREDKIVKTNALMMHHFPKVEGDKVTFIGSTFLTYGSKEIFNHCIVLDTCDPVEGVVIESKPTEKEVLLGWADLIQRENPDIIIGYNIFGFDYEFMFQRAKENGCEQDFLKLARRRGEIGGKKVGDEWVLDKTQIKIASGEYDLRYPAMMGRLQIDLYAYFRRDFNLSSYKLDDVAGQYISDEIKFSEITADGNTKIYSKNLAGLHVGDFIHVKINSFSSDYYKDGQKFRVLAIDQEEKKGKTFNVITIAGEHAIPEPEGSVVSVDWGMAKDDVSPQDIFRLTKGSAADRAIVAKYCIQDCNLVHHLMGKLDVITGYTEMSSICSVPISFLVFRGQGVKLTSYVAKKCREKDTLMPDLEKTGDNEGYEGAIVLPPKCSMYIDNPVACVDYSSLYPSSMISQNYSHDSKVWTKEYDMDGTLKRTTGERDPRDKSGNTFLYDNLPGYHYINIEFKTFRYLRAHPSAVAKKIQTGTKVCRWAQLPNNQKSIMPSILTELLDARSATRKKAKTEPDPFMQNILDKRQLGYKVTANSLYGQCGAKTSTFYDMDVAASTTATGQMMITYAKRMIEEVYGDSVYETAQHGTVKCNAEYVYGDSVANYTPVLIRANRGISEILTIEQVATKYGGERWVVSKESGKEFCELPEVESWTENGWTRLHRVIRHRLHPEKKMFRIATKSGLVDVTDDHSLLMPSGQEISPNDCDIGTNLLHMPPPATELVLYQQFTYQEDCEYFSTDMVYLAKLAYVAQQHGRHIQLENMSHCIALKITKNRQEESATRIVTKESIDYGGKYVYDFTTDNHHFAAGIGNMVVHNTDSVFFTFNLTNPETGEKIRGKPALEMTIEIAQEAAQLCTDYLKPPMGLAYEKTLMPFILLSKKRYVGMLYEDDPNDGYLKFMGLVLKRRDNCDLVKDVYGGILHHLMRADIPSAIQFLYDSLEQLIGGKVSMDKLAITKALRGDYKNPAAIAHRVLADRIGQRDPGNKPKAGDRMKYVYVVKKGAKLQGEKIETPDYIVANRLPIDYTHYITNQLMKPLQQLFGLAIEQIWQLEKKPAEITKFRKDMAELTRETAGDLEIFMKKREKYTSAKIKGLLFDKFLAKVYNIQNGVRTMDSFYGKR